MRGFSLSLFWLAAVLAAGSEVGDNPCKSGKYPNFEEANGYCFFEPLDYKESINEENNEGRYYINMDKARDVCRGIGAMVLQWDINEPGEETTAIKKLRERMADDPPIDCVVLKGDVEYATMNCTIGPESGTGKYIFINRFGDPYLRKQRGNKETAALICQYPGTVFSTTPPTTIDGNTTEQNTTKPAVQSLCKSGKYENSKQGNRHCFFEPPKDEYMDVINEKQHDGMYQFKMDKAREICNRHGAKVLQWDISKTGDETKALKQVRSQFSRQVPKSRVWKRKRAEGQVSDRSQCVSGDPPIDCLVVDFAKLNYNASAGNNPSYVGFLTSGKYGAIVWQLDSYSEEEKAYLICHQVTDDCECQKDE